MSMVKNWLSPIDKKSMTEFFEKNFYTTMGIISADYDEDYGKTYHCHTYESLSETTGIDGFAIQLGNFGCVRKIEGLFGSQKIVDDFMMAMLNHRAFKDYVTFVAKNNIIDGEPVKINGETYREAFYRSFSQFVSKFKNKKFIKSVKCATPQDYENLRNLMENINSELILLEQGELEPSQE